MKRLHRAEIRQALEFSGASLDSQHDILAIVDELIDKNNNLNSMISLLRSKVESYKNTGTTNNSRNIKVYVVNRLIQLKKEAHMYYDPRDMRFSVLSKSKPKPNMEHVGSYKAPFDRDAIREDVDFVFESRGK